MGKLEYFRITLDKPENQEIYFPGEQIVGKIQFRVMERFKINSIYMIIDGTGRVKWSEGTGKNRRTYSARETYLHHKVMIMDKDGSPNSDLFLEPGDYSYGFTLILPANENLPTSFEHPIGRIRYSLNGTIDIPWAIDKHTTKAFSLVRHLDLNQIQVPNLRQPVEVTDEKMLCCGPCKSGPIVGEFTVTKTGFVPGETITSHVSIDNRSRRELKPMIVRLVQMITFHGERFSHHTNVVKRDCILTTSPTTTPAGTRDAWDNIRLVVPAVCPSTLPLPNDDSGISVRRPIIEVAYSLVFSFDAAGMHSSRELTIPVVCGTVPLSISTTQRDSYSPPPYSYEASVFGPTSSKELPPEYEEIIGDVIESNSRTFKPYYPYFSNLLN